MYVNDIKVRNNIEDKGCKYLVRGAWPNLEDLYLGKDKISIGENNIGDHGCRHLAKH